VALPLLAKLLAARLGPEHFPKLFSGLDEIKRPTGQRRGDMLLSVALVGDEPSSSVPM
jgi:hypothetical protein